MPLKECPDSKTLGKYTQDPSLLPQPLDSLEEHLSHCQVCRSKLERIAVQQHPLHWLGFAEVASSDESHEAFAPPEIAGYRLEQLVGQGGFGSVYRAIHEATGRNVAIKITRALNRTQQKKHRLEAEVASRLDHPNLVRLFDSGHVGAMSYSIFEWVDSTLAERISQAVIPIDQITTWMIRITEAIQYLHELKIIHRDLKPSNVLVTQYDEPKVTDFGIAKQLGDESSVQTQSRVVGTPTYMAPEQAGMPGVNIGVGTDIYGLGGVLYALLIGHGPFVGQEPQAVLREVLQAQPISPSLVRKDIPRDLEVICLKCLQKLPSDRYLATSELLSDLRRFRDGEPILARPLSWQTLAIRYMLRQPLVTSLALALMLLFAGSLMVAWQGSRLSERQRLESRCMALVDSLMTASGDRLESLAEQLPLVDPITLQCAIELKWATDCTSVQKLRLACIGTNTLPEALSSQFLVQGIADAEPSELPFLVQRLASRPEMKDPELIRTLQQELKQQSDGPSILPLVALIAAVQPNWGDLPNMAPLILNNLASCPVVEVPLWSQSLFPLRPHLLKELLSQPIPRSQEITTPERTSGAVTVDYVDSLTLRSIAWKWSLDSPSGLAELLSRLPPTSMESLEVIHHALRPQVLNAISEKWRRLHERDKPIDPSMRISGELASILRRDGGLLAGSRGYLLSSPAADLDRLISTLKADGYCLCSIQPFEDSGLTKLALCFELSSDLCRVDLDLPWSEIGREIEEQRSDGYEATSCWSYRKNDREMIAVLWRKGSWGASHLALSQSEIDTMKDNLASTDSNDMETQLWLQETTHSQDRVSIGLLTHRSIAWRSEESRRFTLLYQQSLDIEPENYASRFLEFLADHGSYATIACCNVQSHREKETVLQRLGYEPIEIYRDSHHDAYTSRWYRGLPNDRLAREKKLASLAIAAWMLGDAQWVLESLSLSPDPALRTRVIEWLSQVKRSACTYRDVLQGELNAGQTQGLLLAMASSSPSNWGTTRDETLSVVRSLWDHPNSGVHFAAEFLLRRWAPEWNHELLQRAQHHHPASHDREQLLMEQPDWYYGPHGLPFVKLREDSWQMVGDDENIPWIVNMDRRLAKLESPISICAVETPEWLMRLYWQEAGQWESHRELPAQNRFDGPALGYHAETILRFCRWLSEEDGLDQEQLGLPPLSHIRSGMELRSEYRDRDGYRLPTNLEWEIASRGGTQTMNHLGDGYEFLSSYSWNSTNSETRANTIASRKPNPFGLFDVLGNAYEAAIGESLEEGRRNANGPWILDRDTLLIVRGGSFLSSRIYCTSGSKHGISALSEDINVGFRLVRTLRKTNR